MSGSDSALRFLPPLSRAEGNFREGIFVDTPGKLCY